MRDRLELGAQMEAAGFGPHERILIRGAAEKRGPRWHTIAARWVKQGFDWEAVLAALEGDYSRLLEAE